MVKEILTQAQQRMAKAIEALQKELATVRTGRASPALVEHLQIDVYGSVFPLNQLASITAPEARLLIVQPWDRQNLPAIEKAILRSDLGLNPSSDGQVLRIPIPPLSEERRKEMVRLVRKRIEEGRVSIRNIRREVLEEFRRRLKAKEVSEDEEKRAQEQLQKLTDGFISQANALGERKEQELLEL